jgi:hypothetical protein
MKEVIIGGLIAVGAIAVWKARHGFKVSLALQESAGNVPGGVSIYSPSYAPNGSYQVWAAHPSNPAAVSIPGYAPAFGPDENVPDYDQGVPI